MQRTQFLRLALVLSLLSMQAGCVGGSASTSYSGRRVGVSTMSQIEPGVTTASWVHAALGSPNSKT